MKAYEPKKRPTFRLPGGDDPKKNLISGIVMMIVLFVVVFAIARSGLFGGESLAEYREAHPSTVMQESVEENLQ